MKARRIAQMNVPTIDFIKRMGSEKKSRLLFGMSFFC